MADKVVLNFHDSLLRKSDLELLEGSCWLNDNVITFAFEYFEKVLFAEFADTVCFVSPEVTQFIKLAEGEEVVIFLSPLNLHSKDYVFFAVNDNEMRHSTGGSHWSLLVYVRPENKFLHFDSYGGSNWSGAVQLTNKISPHLASESHIGLHGAACPQQTNGRDCGVYAICFTEQVCSSYLHKRELNLTGTVTPSSVEAKRYELGQLIRELADKGYR